jgi:DegV family protein with EDD domain
MTVKIVTDSTADLPPEIAKKMGITVVPEILRFGNEVLKDNVDITADEFYRRLTQGPVHPSTTQPPPQDFADIYKQVAAKADGIISIHVSAKLSGTCNSALQAAKSADCPVEVIDSEVVTMGLGLLAITASRLAQSGKNLQQVADGVRKMIPSIRVIGLLDTLKYLALGGRIGKMQALLGSALSIKPLMTVKNGVLVPAGRVRSRSKGIELLYDYVKKSGELQELAVIYNTGREEAQVFVKRLGALFPEEKIILAQLGPALGVHAGPGILFLALRGKG